MFVRNMNRVSNSCKLVWKIWFFEDLYMHLGFFKQNVCKRVQFLHILYTWVVLPSFVIFFFFFFFFFLQLYLFRGKIIASLLV